VTIVILQCCSSWVKQAACRTYQVLQGNIDILLPGAFTLCRRPGHCHDALSLLQLPSAMQTRNKHIAEAHLHVCLHSCTVALCMMLLFELLATICRCLQDPCTSCALLCTACKPCRVPSHCLQTAMALRLIEPPALVQSMLSAFMTSIASHANTICQPEAAKSLSADGCGAASMPFLSHLLSRRSCLMHCCCIIACMQSELHQPADGNASPLACEPISGKLLSCYT